MPEESSPDSVRKRIVKKQEESLTHENRNALLAAALMLSFFGSAAVVMPSTGSPTGLFSGNIQIESPDVQEISIRQVNLESNELSFIFDSRIRNPNLVEVKLTGVLYEIKVDGRTIKREFKDGSTVIAAGDTGYVITVHHLDFSGVPKGKIFYREASNGSGVTIEGIMKFSVAGTEYSEPFRRSFNPGE
ncbi:MAG: hypothetical protein ABEJ36_06420 [Candidatus Nanosalina sp.]